MPVALVTGASRGIGKAICMHLADDGNDIAVNDITSQSQAVEEVCEEIRQKGRRAVPVIADVSKEDEVRKMVASTVEALGALNIMVANAGVVVPRGFFEQMVDEWDHVMAINAKGVFLCYREAARQMIAQGNGGKIIGACSQSGHRPSVRGVAYSASKWAVRCLTQMAAMELGKYDITVNAYCPGPIETDMWADIEASEVKRTGVAPGSTYEAAIQSRTVLKKYLTVEDVAQLVCFLASSRSRNITGQSLLVDGGGLFT